MKRYGLFSGIVLFFILFVQVLSAQEEVARPLLQYRNDQDDFRLMVGGRLFADIAYYHSDYTPMKSGAAITDARIRTSFSYRQFYFYADFDFSKGIFKQKDIFVRYYFVGSSRYKHSLSAGYFNEPAGMSRNTSLYNYHFMARAAPAMALSAGRALGVAYKCYNSRFFANQGIFAENKYNDQLSGFQGLSISGRWLYKPVNTVGMTFQVGSSLQYRRINTGKVEYDVLKTNIDIESTMQTYVDATTSFLNAKIPWAKNTLTLSPEFLVVTPGFFVRGECIYKKLYKQRDDEKLFEHQLGNVWSWTTLASWKAANRLKSSDFWGAYVEMSFLLRGERYGYDEEKGLVAGNDGDGTLELVARYSYTDLNDIDRGDFFLIGKHLFYPGGVIVDYPTTSTSIGGGRLHAITWGLNYTFNRYVKVMGEYQYGHLHNVYYPLDKNFHQLQARLMVSF